MKSSLSPAFLTLALMLIVPLATAWSNGYSVQGTSNFALEANQWNRASMYGTHDYLAEYALSFLPEEEKAWVRNVSFFYGTELPDSIDNGESIGDRNAQYLRFDSGGNAVSDLMANRSMMKYDVAVSAISNGENGTASKAVGTILAYITDSGLFSRVIEGPEKGLAFESYIGTLTNAPYPQERFESLFGQYISYDGSLEMISPYDAVMRIGQATYLGKKDSSCSARWMEKNYNIDSEEFLSCAGRDFNNIINAEADVLHTLYKAAHGAAYAIYATDWANYAQVQPGTAVSPPQQQANQTGGSMPATDNATKSQGGNPTAPPADNATALPGGNAAKPPAQKGDDPGNGNGSVALPPADKAKLMDSGIVYLIAVLFIAAIAAFVAMKMLKKASMVKELSEQSLNEPPNDLSASRSNEPGWMQSEMKHMTKLLSGNRSKADAKSAKKPAKKPKAAPAALAPADMPEENPVKALASEGSPKGSS